MCLFRIFKQSDHSEQHHHTPPRKRSILINGNQNAVHSDTESTAGHTLHGLNGTHSLFAAIRFNFVLILHRFAHQSEELAASGDEEGEPNRAVMDLQFLHSMPGRGQHSVVGATVLAENLSVSALPIVPPTVPSDIDYSDRLVMACVH